MPSCRTASDSCHINLYKSPPRVRENVICPSRLLHCWFSSLILLFLQVTSSSSTDRPPSTWSYTRLYCGNLDLKCEGKHTVFVFRVKQLCTPTPTSSSPSPLHPCQLRLGGRRLLFLGVPPSAAILRKAVLGLLTDLQRKRLP